MTSIRTFVQRRIVVLPERATIREAARAMCDQRIGCALISGKNGRPAGILTDRDLACYWGSHLPSQDRAVSEIMSRDLVLADENAGLKEVISLMEAHGVRRVPLVDKKSERFVGIITLDDLVAAQLIEFPQLARIVQRQVGRPDLQPVSTARAENRSGAHKSQTEHRFYAYLSGCTGLSSEQVPRVTQTILGFLVSRVTLTAATHFLAQLPDKVREPLSRLSPGPDKTITPDSVIEELATRYHFSEEYARMVLHRFLSALAGWMSEGQLDHLRVQLPESFSPYFQPPSGKEAA